MAKNSGKRSVLYCVLNEGHIHINYVYKQKLLKMESYRIQNSAFEILKDTFI